MSDTKGKLAERGHFVCVRGFFPLLFMLRVSRGDLVQAVAQAFARL